MATTTAELGPEYIDISEKQDRGVLKKIIREGHSGGGGAAEATPPSGSNVHVHYVGTLFGGDTHGQQFDSSRARGDLFKFVLGQGQVIKAWDCGVATMRRGELAELICAPEYAYGASGSGGSIPPNATLKFEVELFKWTGNDISPAQDESVVETQIKEGSGYDSPKEGNRVTVKMAGSLAAAATLKAEGGEEQAATPFDSRTVEFEIGDGEEANVCAGVEIALKKMKKFQTSRVEIKAKHAFGANPKGIFGVPPNSDVVYELTLISFEKFKESWNVEGCEEKLKYAEDLKTRGTEKFKLNKFKLAKIFYEKAATFVETDYGFKKEEELDKKRVELLLSLHLNQSLCALRLENTADCVAFCDKAIELSESKNEKAFFRRAQAHQFNKNWELAKADYSSVLQIDANNAAARANLAKCEQEIKSALQKEKNLYKNIFSKMAKQAEKETGDAIGASTNNSTENKNKSGESEDESDEAADDSKTEEAESIKA